MFNFEPLRITAYLQTPVVSDETLPLDGVLLHCALREKLGFQAATLPGETTAPPGGVKLPLRRRWRDKDGNRLKFEAGMMAETDYWYYACSFARWSNPVAEDSSFYVKRFDTKYADIVDFRGKRGKVIVERGKYKAYKMPIYSRHALYVRWYAFGDAAEIKRLLQFAFFLGKKTVQGCGAVREWQVEPFAEDWSEYNKRELTRAMPSSEGVMFGFRPSYHLPLNQAVCELPQNYQDF